MGKGVKHFFQYFDHNDQIIFTYFMKENISFNYLTTKKNQLHFVLHTFMNTCNVHTVVFRKNNRIICTQR